MSEFKCEMNEESPCLQSIRRLVSDRIIIWAFISACLQFSAAAPYFSQSVVTENAVSSKIEELQIQSDRKILVGGTRTSKGVDSFALARFLKDGAIDTTFGSGGNVSTVIGRSSKLFAVALQPDGKIVAAGYSDTGKAHVVAIARYNPNGSLDTTFGSGGKVTTAAGGNYGRAFSVLIQADGKILAAGHSNTTPRGFDLFLVRYNPDGSIDKTFGRSGVVNAPLGRENNGGQAAMLQKDGKIVAVGQMAAAGKRSMVAARFIPTGSLDTTFTSQGKVTIPAGKDSSASTLTLLGDAGILVGGYSNGPSVSEKIGEILLLDKNGGLDRSFAKAGRLTVQGADINVLKVDGDSIIAAGNLGSNEDGACRAYQRVGRTGTLLAAAYITNEEDMCEISDLAIQSDGRILVTGSFGSFRNPDIALLRFNKDNTLDRSFGSNGTVIFEF